MSGLLSAIKYYSMDKDWVGNKKSVWTTNGCSNHSMTEREVNDFYATSPVALEKLATKFRIPHNVWECACGMGHLSEHLKEHGHNVYSSDLVDRGYGVTGTDFLKETELPSELPHNNVCILTNPPYKYSTEFVLHAIDLLPTGGFAAFLLKTTALEGKGRFERIYRDTPPIFVYQFVERLLCAKSGDFETARKTLGAGAQAYMWAIWKKGYKGTTTLDWV